MFRTPWPWETAEEAEAKERELRERMARGSALLRRDASALSEFKEMDAAFAETDDKSFAVKREIACRKENARVFAKARERISGRLADDRIRRNDLMRKLGMQPFSPQEE